MMERLFSIRAVAGVLDVSPRTVYRLVASGELLADVQLGSERSLLRVRESELSRFIESRTVRLSA